jgi:hypothetical protein
MLNIVSSILAPQVAASTNSYESIATFTLATATATITFSAIPQTYTHLQIRATFRESIASVNGDTRWNFNGDTAANYHANHDLYGNGTAAGASQDPTTTLIWGMFGAGNNLTASVFGVGIMDILDYTSTSKTKVTRTLSGYDNNGSGTISLRSGLWLATPAAITSITIAPDSGNFLTYSSFALYGIKG